MAELGGRGVLVTRPIDQAADLVAAIEAANGRAFEYPALEIRGGNRDDIETAMAELPEPDISLFVSPNAVRFGLEFAGSGRIGAIGPATAAAIRAAGRDVDITPDGGYDSEHLLTHDTLRKLDGQVVRILRGQSGRELLGSTLAHRGARVDYLSVYARTAPAADPELTRSLLGLWRDGGIDAWTIMSVETLVNFLAMTGPPGAELAACTPLVTPAERVITVAKERLPGVFATLSDGTSPEALVDAIDSVMVYEQDRG